MTHVERLVRIYLDSKERLLKELEKRILWGRSTRNQQDLMQAIDRELQKLNLESMAWAQEAIEAAYTRAARLTWQAAHTANTAVKSFGSFSGLHNPAIDLLAHNAQDFLQITNNLIARQAKDKVRQLGVEVTGKKFAETLTVKQTRTLLMERLQEESFYSVPWRNGRGSMRVDSYAELVARTTTREATMTATYNQAEALGHHLYKMTSHNTTCKVCASRQGRVYRSIDFPAGDPRQAFPHISQGFPRWPVYKTVHPNCAHVANIFIWDEKTPEEQRAALADAGQPFNHDPRGEAERKRYEDAQRKNAQRLRDRKQWEQYRGVLGKENMPSFSGFRRMKAAGSENYRFMRLDYLRQNRLKLNPELALPNASKATAADEKFTKYLFNPDNKDGWAKGVAFTSRLGYNTCNWEDLKANILGSAIKYPSSIHGQNMYGTLYEQPMVLYGPSGKPANVKIGWCCDDEDTWMTTAMLEEWKDGKD